MESGIQNIKYHTLPLDFENLTSLERTKTCNLKESIAHYLHLIATTYLGECQFDVSFGCSIWDFDFDNAISDSTLKDNLKTSLIHAVLTNEKRLKDVDVSVKISQVEVSSTLNTKRVKKKVDVRLKARLIKTNEPIEYFEYFFLGPLSYY